MSASAIDWDDRRLCPDDACIGVLDDAGRCPVCGKQGAAADPHAVRAAPPAEPVEDAPPSDAAAAAASSDGSDDLDDRELCSDGACIGVLGADRRCKVCGKAA